ncbi:hypothetical protein CcCBS67573_g09146 [Chytriomyces confervae]|uniref:Uncharacterized protein n=1 Tax=Chytriomyces confervae TaxID=246404 RepID=A0A507E4A5_9FUNG|nr:hypothetical protein CcCBS67573_g09146 [Chytriomyces confervae]
MPVLHRAQPVTTHRSRRPANPLPNASRKDQLELAQLHSPTTNAEPPRAKTEIAASHLDLVLRWNAARSPEGDQKKPFEAVIVLDHVSWRNLKSGAGINIYSYSRMEPAAACECKRPQTMIEQYVAVLFICLGAILYAGFLVTISSAVMSLNPSGRLYNQKVEELFDHVQWKKLDAETSEKLISYYETKYRGKCEFKSRSSQKVLRTATVQAAMPTVVYRLSNTDFHTVISEFLDMKLRIKKLAIEGQRVVLATDDGRGSFIQGRRKTFLN